LFGFQIQHLYLSHDLVHRNVLLKLFVDTVHGILVAEVVGLHDLKKLRHFLRVLLHLSQFCCPFPPETVVREKTLHFLVLQPKLLVLGDHGPEIVQDGGFYDIFVSPQFQLQEVYPLVLGLELALKILNLVSKLANADDQLLVLLFRST